VKLTKNNKRNKVSSSLAGSQWLRARNWPEFARLEEKILKQIWFAGMHIHNTIQFTILG
jgi:hypothetical protein